MNRPLLPPGSAAAARVDHLCLVALTRELGPYWTMRDLPGRLNASISSMSRHGVFLFMLQLDGVVIVSETITPDEVRVQKLGAP